MFQCLTSVRSKMSLRDTWGIVHWYTILPIFKSRHKRIIIMLVSNNCSMSGYVDRMSKKIRGEVFQKYVYLVFVMDVFKNVNWYIKGNIGIELKSLTLTEICSQCQYYTRLLKIFQYLKDLFKSLNTYKIKRDIIYVLKVLVF